MVTHGFAKDNDRSDPGVESQGDPVSLVIEAARPCGHRFSLDFNGALMCN